MLHNILVPVDGSPLSLRALDFAMEMGKAGDSKITVLHVTVPLNLEMLRSYEAEALDEAIYAKIVGNDVAVELSADEKVRADVWALRVAEKRADECGYPKIQFKDIVDREPAKAILEQADEAQADVIAIGYSGLGFLSGKLMGSVSNKVISHAGKPVVIVK